MPSEPVPGVVFDTAAGPEAHGRRLTGQDAVRAAFAAVWTDMPDVAWTVSRHTLAGERATSEWLFTGTRADNSTVMQTFTVDQVGFFFRTFTFTGFTNLVSVKWQQPPFASAPGSPGLHQFDNIQVVPVPEPGALAYWTTAGLLATVGYARRRGAAGVGV